ncbi:RecX family transcriptional regulator [candidate division NPL-UPA2 bacterium]|nr:RecX family transcriptional regulator [candidate division NPL-UPA2 bacterium]
MKKVITALERQGRHPRRRSLFLEGKFICGLDEEIVRSLKLKVGQEIDEAEVSQAIFKEEVRKAKDYALNLLTYRPRSCQEIRDKLKGKNYDEKVGEEVINQLQELNFLDDSQFARSWAESRLLNKPMGRRLLEQELRQKGIAGEIIEGVSRSTFDKHNEEELALALAKKRLKSYLKLDELTRKRRLYSYLGRRGFSPEIISQVLEQIEVNYGHREGIL